jgi:hypothetical protein
MLYPVCSLETVYGIPPFPRFSPFDNYIIDQVDSGNATEIDDMPINISSVTYLSDGNNLNATLWLNDPILTERHRDYLESNLTYVMNVYSVDAREGFETGILYSVVISPEEDGSWTKKVIEHAPGAYWPNLTSFTVDDVVGASRTLKIYPNYTGFLQNDNTYVNIDLALKDIGNPPEAKIEFGAYIEEGGNSIDDWTYLLDAPGRQSMHIFDWPELLEVRAGENATGRVLIHNFELPTRGNIALQQNARSGNYDLEFNPNRIEYPLNGTISSDFEVRISPNVTAGTLPLQVIVTPSTIENVIGSPWVETFNITVQQPLSALDVFVIFLIDGYALYWIPFSATIAFGLWLSTRIDKRKLSQDTIEKSRTKDIIEKLKPQDILTANASVVAGVLIFLTVGGTELFESDLIIHISILTASIVFPFAISAIRILITSDPLSGIKFTIPGFVLLMIAVVLITVVLAYQNPQNI